MRSLIITAPEKPKTDKPTFPVLKKHKYYGFVVLFTSRRSGTVVSSPKENANYPVGFYSSNWVDLDANAWAKVPENKAILLVND